MKNETYEKFMLFESDDFFKILSRHNSLTFRLGLAINGTADDLKNIEPGRLFVFQKFMTIIGAGIKFTNIPFDTNCLKSLRDLSISTHNESINLIGSANQFLNVSDGQNKNLTIGHRSKTVYANNNTFENVTIPGHNNVQRLYISDNKKPISELNLHLCQNLIICDLTGTTVNRLVIKPEQAPMIDGISESEKITGIKNYYETFVCNTCQKHK